MNYYHFLSNSIQKQHAVIFNKKGVIEIESVSGSGSKTKINGIPLTGRKALCHKDRILFGTKDNLFSYCMNIFGRNFVIEKKM